MFKNRRRLLLIAVVTVVATLSQRGSARDLLVSSVILGTPTLTQGICPNYDSRSLTTDSNRYPAGGTYECPNGSRGNLAASPSPLVASGDVLCTFGARTCSPTFAAPTTGADSIGPYASVRVTERGISLSGCQDGNVLTFTTHTSNVYDTSAMCQDCYNGCPPGYTTNCVGDQQPDNCGCCVNYSPIIVDLGGDGIAFSSAAEGVIFQINSVGSIRRIAWPLRADDAWLALDRDGNGLIDSGAELFGNTTPMSNGEMSGNGYQALAEFDENMDGVIDARDPIFSALRLWTDADRDGLTDSGELLTLSDAGIVALSVEPRESAHRDRWGNRFTLRARVTRSSPPRVSFSYDVYPVTEPIDGAPSCVTVQSAKPRL